MGQKCTEKFIQIRDEELRECCVDKLGKYKVPKQITRRNQT